MRGDPSTPRAGERDILELRVHGVRNTPPQEMLGVAVDQIEIARDGAIPLADRLAGFYTAKDPDPAAPTRIEAYSWGHLDRFAKGRGFLTGVWRTAYNVVWFLVAPFGFANAGYWARAFETDPGREGGLRTGSGGGITRLFGLALTLLLTSAVSTVVFDLVAVQCFLPADRAGTWRVCSALPGQLDGLGQWTRGQRLALFSLAPLAAVAAMAILGLISDVRFRTRIHDAARVRAARGAPDALPLAVPEMWMRRRVNSPTGLTHLAASLDLVVATLAWDAAPHDGAAAPTLFVLALVHLAASAAMIAFWARSVRAPHPVPDCESLLRRLAGSRDAQAGLLLVLAAVIYVLCLVLEIWGAGTNVPGPFGGGQLTPTLILVALTVLATAGCVVRAGYNEWIAAAVLSTGTAALWALLAGWLDPLGPGANAAALAVVVLSGVAVVVPYLSLRRRNARAREEAWHGAGPGVFMFLGLLVGAFLASALALGAGAFLRSGRFQTSAVPGDPLFRAVSLPGGAHDIAVPIAFWAFGGVLGLMAAVVMLVLIVVGLLKLRSTTIDDPAIDPTEECYRPEIARQRRASAFLQRAEPLLHFIAWTVGVAVATSLALAVLWQYRDRSGRWAWVRGVLASAFGADSVAALWQAGQLIVLTSVVLGGAAVLALAVAKAAAPDAARPLGLLWDLMAWLPRAAHPFGPACYSERAVPELADRMIRWLEPDGVPDPRRRVLLATHSLGTVLGVAALFHLAATGHADLLPRVRLLSFGMQLRPYFGRFFPELFGPDVLGTPGVGAPSFWTADPWKGKDLPVLGTPPRSRARVLARVGGSAGPGSGAHDAGRSPAAGPLTALLGSASVRSARPGTDGQGAAQASPAQPVWLNLWRRTDYLGFPGYSYARDANVLDRLALEMEPDSYMAQVATHGNYLPTVAYLEARRDLLLNW
ncbi:hypothetical protein J2W21_000683 [Sinomonas atrocyanea]|uniref:hypothetical protein n=1 Tax=Sinomonas atrocyanea TaxID=37927 RepID=UPI002780352B|nr:hypothetical protein [Sinomonas atrocyanea]MDP9883193.1 hypothetical protein [Sinomonas atrocyanea]